VNLLLNLWYSPMNVHDSLPLIFEFTFNYKAKKQAREEITSLEQFPLSVVSSKCQAFEAQQLRP
jgi:hypothetical protein